MGCLCDHGGTAMVEPDDDYHREISGGDGGGTFENDARGSGGTVGIDRGAAETGK